MEQDEYNLGKWGCLILLSYSWIVQLALAAAALLMLYFDVWVEGAFCLAVLFAVGVTFRLAFAIGGRFINIYFMAATFALILFGFYQVKRWVSRNITTVYVVNGKDSAHGKRVLVGDYEYRDSAWELTTLKLESKHLYVENRTSMELVYYIQTYKREPQSWHKHDKYTYFCRDSVYNVIQIPPLSMLDIGGIAPDDLMDRVPTGFKVSGLTPAYERKLSKRAVLTQR